MHRLTASAVISSACASDVPTETMSRSRQCPTHCPGTSGAGAIRKRNARPGLPMDSTPALLLKGVDALQPSAALSELLGPRTEVTRSDDLKATFHLFEPMLD